MSTRIRWAAASSLLALLVPIRSVHAEDMSKAGAPLDARSGSNADYLNNLSSAIDEVSTKKFLHGFRLGYLYVMNIDGPIDTLDPDSPSLTDKYGVRSPHQFLLGYELLWRMIGHEWLNILLLTNVMVSGFEQSKFFPSMNGLIGFEIADSFQVGVGVNAMPTRDKPAHMIAAVGWTPRIGDFYVPVHSFFVPDVDGQHRLGVTIGANW